MFQKLITNLPFNPSLIGQVSFYAKQLRQEESLRRLGFGFVAFAMVLQMFAVMAPPEKSLASSSNHILDGLSVTKSPTQNKQFLLSAWDANTDNIKAIYGYFGVTRDDLANMAVQHDIINPLDGNDWWTTGRNSLEGYPVSAGFKNSQVAVEYAPGNFIYQRQLVAWNEVYGYSKTWPALRGTIARTGQTFWIVLDCGNFTTVGRYVPPPPPPPPPPPTIGAACSIAGPVVVPRGTRRVTIPVRVAVAQGTSISHGSISGDGRNAGTGLHLGVASVGSNMNWDQHEDSALMRQPLTPPDKQNDFSPSDSSLSGVTYYSFVWNDGHTYRRYYVNNANHRDFTVNITVNVEDMGKKLAVRLLDRDKGKWLPHNSGCEVNFTETPPAPPEPSVRISKTIIDRKASYKPGDQMTYLIQYQNTVNASVAENVVISDPINTQNFDIVSVSPAATQVTDGTLRFEIGSLPYRNTAEEIRVTVRLKSNIESGTRVCNASRLTVSNTRNVLSQICTTVIVPCPYNNTVPDANSPGCTPTIACDTVDAAINLQTRTVRFRTTVESSHPSAITAHAYYYDFGDGSPVLTQTARGLTDEATHTFPTGEFTTKVQVEYSAPGVSGRQKADCEAPIRFDAPLSQSKEVENLTQNKSGRAAMDSQVKGGDTISYTLRTSNGQGYERTGIEISDYIGDLLDYATLDMAYLESQGGSFDESTKKVVWKNVAIPAHSDITRMFRIKVKDPIPSTNTPSATTTNFDCRLSNEYGNEITLLIDCPIQKDIETAITTLPKTGPGSSLIIGFTATTIIAYFFARSRLLSKELELIQADFAHTGGI